MVCIMFQIMFASIQNIYDKEIVLLSYFNALFIICLTRQWENNQIHNLTKVTFKIWL